MVYIHPSSDMETLTLSAKNTNSLILGGSAAEGGNILGYRDSSGNTGFSVDMDAASGSKGLYLYAGGVFESNVTIGQSTLNTTYPLYVVGNTRITGITTNELNFVAYRGIEGIASGYGISAASNAATIFANINVSGTDAIDHTIKLKIDDNDIIVVQATGDGAGGITNPGAIIPDRVTIGQSTLNLTYPLYVVGNAYISQDIYSQHLHPNGSIYVTNGNGLISGTTNIASMVAGNIRVDGTDATDHIIKMQIDGNSIIEVQATGDGAAGITNKAVGFFGVSVQTQQAHIIDANGDLADITTKFNTLLADLEGYGLLLTS